MTYVLGIVLGLVAGFACGIGGVTATIVAAPILMAVLGMPAYEATSIGLLTDIVSAGSATASYARKGHVDFKSGTLMLILILVFTVVGSWLGSMLPNLVLGHGIVAVSALSGLFFIVFSKGSEGMVGDFMQRFAKHQKLLMVLASIWVGLICGSLGMGGGAMVLMILSYILCYEMKDALGTSLLITIFVATVALVSHVLIGELPPVGLALTVAASAFVGSKIAALVALRVEQITLNRIIGGIMIGVAVLSWILGLRPSA